MISRFALVTAIAAIMMTANSADAQFVLGVNLGGDAVTINGNLWQSDAAALAGGFSFTTAGSFSTFTYAQTPTPAVDANTSAMLNDVRYIPFGTASVTIHQAVANGQAYVVQLWAFEAVQGNARLADVTGDVASTNFDNLPLYGWEARSLTTGIVNDGSIDFTITPMINQPVLSGYAIFAIPEPAAGSLIMVGVAAMTGLRRRRQ